MLNITSQVSADTRASAENIPLEVLQATQPLVMRGLVQHWPVVKASRQSPSQAADYLRRYYQGKPVVVSVGKPEIDGRVFYNATFTDFNYESHKVNLNQLLDKLLLHLKDEKPPTLYMGSTVVDDWLPGLRQENDLALQSLSPRVGIWLGNKNRIAAHWDLPTNIACTVAGHRRVTLFPPDQLENLYPGPLTWAPGGQAISLVDFHQPDYTQFPKFKEALAHAQIVELHPGDALLIPSMWWHHVESLAPFNILINYWWRDVPQYMGTPMNVLHHALLTLRDLPAEQRKVWQEIFTHYIFEHNGQTHDHIPEHAQGVLGEMDEDKARKLRAFLLSQLNR
ncbi:hypothetical protein TDB9533_00585 [Thalassocella blandensis]|nr:hypothetical protein TDB9533_00585 [Thalassocella blandensis]